MRNIFFILLLIASGLTLNAQDTCSGNYQKVIYSGDTVIVECERMVIMNPETFAQYYHDSKSLENLREDIPEWRATIDSLEVVNNENRQDLDSIATLRHSQMLSERASKEEVIEDLIDAESKNVALKKDNRRWKVFSGASTGLSVILLLILL